MHIFSCPIGVLLGILAGIGNVLGGFFVTRPFGKDANREMPWSGGGLHAMMQIGAGFLLAVTVLETIPWSISNSKSAHMGAAIVLGGYLMIHLFEHTIAPHFHFGEETHSHDVVSKSVAQSALFGLTIHSLFDGVAIGASASLSHSLGWLVFIAILLHKIPEGATCSSIAIVASYNRMQAFFTSIIVGAATLVGVAVVLLWRAIPTGSALALAAGVTLYVSATDLIPHGNAEEDKRMPLLVFVGVALFMLTDALLESLHVM